MLDDKQIRADVISREGSTHKSCYECIQIFVVNFEVKLMGVTQALMENNTTMGETVFGLSMLRNLLNYVWPGHIGRLF